MKNKLLILLLILLPGGMIFSIEADTLWRADLGSSINDYKISPDDSKVLVHRDGAFEMLDSDNGENLWTLPISSTANFFFLPQNSNQIIALKSLSEYYLIDANIGSVIDTIRIDGGLEVTPYSADISFDGRYLVGTYRTKVGEVKYSNGEVKTHAYYKMHIVDLESKKVHYDGYELISSSLIEMGNFDYSLIRSSFNASTIEYNLYKFIVTQEGISSEINNIVSCDCIFPGFTDIEFMNNENSFSFFQTNGQIFKYSLNDMLKTEIFSPYASSSDISRLSLSFNDNYLLVTETIESIININTGDLLRLSEIGNGWTNYKFGFGNLNHYLQRSFSIYKIETETILSFNSNHQANESLYPNPSNNLITVTFSNKFPAIFEYIINDINSNVILQSQLDFFDTGHNSTDINISNLPSGIFFLKVYSENEIFEYKIVKVN